MDAAAVAEMMSGVSGLAEMLGVAAGELVEVFAKRWWVTVVEFFAWSTMLAATLSGSVYCSNRLRNEDYNASHFAWGCADDFRFGFFALGIISVFLLICTVMSMVAAVSAAASPEAYGISQILNAVKGG